MRCVMQSSPVRGRVLAAAVLAVAGMAVAAQAQTTWRVVAKTGTDNQYGPNGGAGRFFASFGTTASINNAGQVLFIGTDNQTTAQSGLFGRWTTGTSASDLNTRVAATTQAVPSNSSGAGAAQTYSGFLSPLLNSNLQGGVGQYTSRINSNAGYIANQGSGIQRLYYTGDAAPDTGTPAANWASPGGNGPWLNQNGQTMFLGTLAAGTGTPAVVTTAGVNNATGVWITDSTNTPRLAARQNDAVLNVGTASEIRLGAFTNTTMNLNNSGRFLGLNTMQAGTGVLTTSGVTQNNVALVSNRSGTTQVVLRSNTTPAVDASGATISGENLFFTSSSNTSFNNAGQFAIAATTRNSAGTTVTSTGIYSDISGTFRGYARGGTSLPPTVNRAVNNEFAGLTWSTTSQHTVQGLNGAGQIAFSGNFTGPGVTASVNSQALFRQDPDGTLTKIIRQGDVLYSRANNPSLPSDVTYSSIQGNVQMNAYGEMLFLANLSGTNVNGGGFFNNFALIGVDTFGNAIPLLRRGDLFDPGDGSGPLSIINISSYSAAGGQDGRALSLSDSGDFVVQMDLGTYTTSASGPGTSSISYSGIFAFKGIPAPGASVLLGMGGLIAGRRRRR